MVCIVVGVFLFVLFLEVCFEGVDSFGVVLFEIVDDGCD